MLKKIKEIFGVGDSFDQLVEKELEKQPLAQLYFRMRQCSPKDNLSLLDKIDEYVRLSCSPKAIKTRAFDELETTLKFDIYQMIEGDFYEEIKSSLAIPTEVLKTCKSLSDEKRALFRKSLTSIPHKKKMNSSALNQKTRA